MRRDCKISLNAKNGKTVARRTKTFNLCDEPNRGHSGLTDMTSMLTAEGTGGVKCALLLTNGAFSRGNQEAILPTSFTYLPNAKARGSRLTFASVFARVLFLSRLPFLPSFSSSPPPSAPYDGCSGNCRFPIIPLSSASLSSSSAHAASNKGPPVLESSRPRRA